MATLTAVLDAIFISAWPIGERRRLVAHAVRQAVGGSSMASVKEELPIDKLEEVLHAVQVHGKLDIKPSITVAKGLLRQCGIYGSQLASRVSRLSKARNSVAHPDISFMEEIKVALDVFTDKSQVSDAETNDTDDVSGAASLSGYSASSIDSDSVSDEHYDVHAQAAATAVAGDDNDDHVDGPSEDIPDQSDSEGEELVEVSSDKKRCDPYLRKRISVLVDDCACLGRVVNIEVGAVSKQVLYRISFDDGDEMHLSSEEVKDCRILSESDDSKRKKRGVKCRDK